MFFFCCMQTWLQTAKSVDIALRRVARRGHSVSAALCALHRRVRGNCEASTCHTSQQCCEYSRQMLRLHLSSTLYLLVACVSIGGRALEQAMATANSVEAKYWELCNGWCGGWFGMLNPVLFLRPMTGVAYIYPIHWRTILPVGKYLQCREFPRGPTAAQRGADVLHNAVAFNGHRFLTALPCGWDCDTHAQLPNIFT